MSVFISLASFFHPSGENHPLFVIPKSFDGKLEEMTDPHIHSGWELKFLNTGIMELIPPGMVHPESPHDTLRATLACNGTDFYFKQGADILFLNAPAGEYGAVLVSLFEAYRHLPEEAPSTMRESLVEAACEAGCQMVLSAMHRNSSSQDCSDQALCQRIRDFLLREYHRPNLSMTDLADFMGLSLQYMNRLLHRCGMSPAKKELLAIRMTKARALLQDGYLVSDTAKLTGWQNQFYFSLAYKKYWGIPPVQTKAESQESRNFQGITQALTTQIRRKNNVM